MILQPLSIKRVRLSIFAAAALGLPARPAIVRGRALPSRAGPGPDRPRGRRVRDREVRRRRAGPVPPHRHRGFLPRRRRARRSRGAAARRPGRGPSGGAGPSRRPGPGGDRHPLGRARSRPGRRQPERHALRRLCLSRGHRRLPLVDRDGQPHALEALSLGRRTSPSASGRRSNTGSPIWSRRFRSRLGGPQQGQRDAGRRRRRAGRPPGLRGFRPYLLHPHPAGKILRLSSGMVQRDRRPEDIRERPALPDE